MKTEYNNPINSEGRTMLETFCYLFSRCMLKLQQSQKLVTGACQWDRVDRLSVSDDYFCIGLNAVQ